MLDVEVKVFQFSKWSIVAKRAGKSALTQLEQSLKNERMNEWMNG